MKYPCLAVSIACVLAAQIASAAEFKLSSPDIGPYKQLAQEFVYSGSGCSGGNQSPALSWKDAPAGTKSYAISLFDADAMNGKGFWHWVVANIPAGTTSLARDTGRNDGTKTPSGAVQVKNGFRATGYSGSCPPVGEKPHTYTYTVYALSTEQLDISSDANPSAAIEIIEAQSLGKATLEYQFGRTAK